MITDIITSSSSNADLVARFRRIAAKAKAPVRILKFTKGRFEIGADLVTNRTYIVPMDQLRVGWVKFGGGKVVDERLGKVADGFIEAERDTLGDLDENAWEIDMARRPRDPWVLTNQLPLVDQESGAVAVFVTNSRGGLDAVAGLADIYARNLHLGLPIVRLAVDSYEHKSFGRIEVPTFPVIGWDASGVVTPEIEIKSIDGPPVATRRSDMDDDIPF